MLCKSFLLIGVVTGYFPVTPSKAVGKGQDAFRYFCSSFAEPCGYTQADLYFPWCMFLIQKQTLYPVFAMVKVCFGPQSSRVGALSLTVTLHGDAKELSQTLPETCYAAAAFRTDAEYFLFPEKIQDWFFFDMWWTPCFQNTRGKKVHSFGAWGCIKRLLSGTVITSLDFSVGEMTK